MHLVVIGLNHETAPIDLREKLRISEPNLPEALQDLEKQLDVEECLILSTCNRTEVYACASNRLVDDVIKKWLSRFCGVAPDLFSSHLYILSGHKAAEHLFRVVTSIDSLIIGEAQILGQVKHAFTLASKEGTTGSILNSLFQQALAVGKRARTETEIGRGAFSVSSVAVQLAKSIFGELAGRTVLVVGASKMGELTMTHLISSGATKIMVTNRTYTGAVDLAARFGGEPVEFEHLSEAMHRADIVLTATSSNDPIITGVMISPVMRARHGRPIFFIDIAVPRDIAPEVGKMDNVFVYNIDDLQSVMKADQANRKAEGIKVESIIREEVAQFTSWFRALDAIPVITALRGQFEEIQEAELSRLCAKLRHLSADDLEQVQLSMRTLVNKICHQPMIQIKDFANRHDAAAKLDTVCEVFGICPESKTQVEPEPAAEPKVMRSAE